MTLINIEKDYMKIKLKYGFLVGLFFSAFAELPELYPQASAIEMPWRGNYLKKHNETASDAAKILDQALPKEGSEVKKTCPLCRAIKDPIDEFIIGQTTHFLLVLNKYPYTCGHLLIVAKQHIANRSDLSLEALIELAQLEAISPTVLMQSLGCHGVNIGTNQGECAGATIPDHLHVQIVPRQKRIEHGFLTTVGNTHTLPCDLSQVHQVLKEPFKNIETKFKQ